MSFKVFDVSRDGQRFSLAQARDEANAVLLQNTVSLLTSGGPKE